MAGLTNAKIAKALKDSRGMITVAARKLGCARNTVYNRMEKSEELREVLAEARDFTTDVAEIKLFTAIEAGEGWAIKYYLSTQGKARGYVERQEMDLRTPDGIQVRTVRVPEVVTDVNEWAERFRGAAKAANGNGG